MHACHWNRFLLALACTCTIKVTSHKKSSFHSIEAEEIKTVPMPFQCDMVPACLDMCVFLQLPLRMYWVFRKCYFQNSKTSFFPKVFSLFFESQSKQLLSRLTQNYDKVLIKRITATVSSLQKISPSFRSLDWAF